MLQKNAWSDKEENIMKNTNKPIMTSELFTNIVNILCEKNLLPNDILDYDMATHNNEPITTYYFDFINSLNYGSNEGIYLDLYIEIRSQNGSDIVQHLGTFKTLLTSDDAMRKMGILLADFVIEGTRYVNLNIDRFEEE